MYNLNRKIAIIITLALLASNASGQWVNVGLFGRTSRLVVSGSNLFADARANAPIQANEIFHSTDSGASWNQFGNPPDSVNFFSLLGAVDTILFANDHRFNNIFRSADNGKTWSLNSLPNFGVFDILGGNGKPVIIFATAPSGVYFSMDTGNSWIATQDSGLDDDDVFTFAMIGSNLYAGGEFSGFMFQPIWAIAGHREIPV